mmetsp:Transcript_95874/g.310781  ORF Transcript_95874/g.310781 Transcript_95874/m.310781 type:complete len:236 (-) Transcript_95874:156-863(-)
MCPQQPRHTADGDCAVQDPAVRCHSWTRKRHSNHTPIRVDEEAAGASVQKRARRLRRQGTAADDDDLLRRLGAFRRPKQVPYLTHIVTADLACSLCSLCRDAVAIPIGSDSLAILFPCHANHGPKHGGLVKGTPVCHAVAALPDGVGRAHVQPDLCQAAARDSDDEGTLTSPPTAHDKPQQRLPGFGQCEIRGLVGGWHQLGTELPHVLALDARSATCWSCGGLSELEQRQGRQQ